MADKTSKACLAENGMLFLLFLSVTLIEGGAHRTPYIPNTMHHHHEPTYARPSLPVIPDPNLIPPNIYGIALHYTAAPRKKTVIYGLQITVQRNWLEIISQKEQDKY